jgi:peptidoglycan/xylan/chitin deacetylase (PgdA/CDA1 family)
VADLWTRVPKPLQRRLARWFSRRPCRIQLEPPIISFSFDDFPRSALVEGGAILCEQGFGGTYYASFGRMGQMAPTGDIFSRGDLPEFLRQGHELACHTFDHCDAWDTAPAEFEASMLRNQQFVGRELPGTALTSLSYPISWPRPQTKRRVAKHYRCARGGGQTFNAGITDLNYLKAFFLEQSREDFDAIKRTMDDNARARGWLIFATHDICGSPTRFGCTPRFFKQVVEYATESGAAVLPICEAYKRIQPRGRLAQEATEETEGRVAVQTGVSAKYPSCPGRRLSV